MVIGSNFGAPYSANRFVIFGVALALLVLSFTFEYLKHVAEEKQIAIIAAENERIRLEEEAQKAEAARLQAEADRLKAEEAERQAAKLKKQQEAAAARQKEQQAALLLKQQEEDAKKAERSQLRSVSFHQYNANLQGQRRTIFNAERDCLYYDAPRNRRNLNYIKLQVAADVAKFQFTNSSYRRVRTLIVYYDDMEQNCQASFRALYTEGHLGQLNLGPQDWQRAVRVRQDGAIWPTENSQTVSNDLTEDAKPGEVIGEIVGDAVNNVLNNIFKKK